MAFQYGKDWRVHIGDGGGTEVFDPIGGEGTFDKQHSSDAIDFSSKDDSVYKSSGWGLQSISISVSGVTTLPDDGLERLADIAKTSPPEVNIQIKKGAIVKFACRMGVGNFSYSAANNGAVTWSATLTNVAAPTVDDIAATS